MIKEIKKFIEIYYIGDDNITVVNDLLEKNIIYYGIISPDSKFYYVYNKNYQYICSGDSKLFLTLIEYRNKLIKEILE